MAKSKVKVYDDQCRRCSISAGDPQGGCQNFYAGTCRPISVMKAKECTKYTPMLVVV